MMRQPNGRFVFWGVILLSLALAFMSLSSRVSAAPIQQVDTPSPQSEEVSSVTDRSLLSINDKVCLNCHGQPGLTMQLENGDVLELYVPPEDHAGSIHGRLGYACVQCHTTVGDYPHPPFSATDIRDASLQLYEACKRCHSGEYERTMDSAHAVAFADGKREAAICTDCHTAHAIQQLDDPITGELLPEAHIWVPRTCARCHNAIYGKYLTSVHGSALTDEGNRDVPTCIDCHGVHNIEDPRTSTFRVYSPQICSKCHTDPELMAKYGLSTEVLNTYVADFHGTTVTLFQKQSPEDETNKPVCYDCHGVHDIKQGNDPEKGLHVRENLLARCQVCHPDATISFPDSWLSHYIPSLEKTPMVYYVDLFYKLFIPGTLGGMALLVLLDLGSSVRRRFLETRPDRSELQPVGVSSDDEEATHG